MLKLDLGGGRFPRVGYLNVDRFERADVRCEFEDNLPFKDSSAEAIFASHLLEHISDLKGLMNECWRILINEGSLEILVPRFPHTDSVVDPTHCRFFVEDTFKYFQIDHPLRKVYGFKPWNIESLGYSDNEVYCILRALKIKEWSEEEVEMIKKIREKK